MKDTIILVLILPRYMFCHEKNAQNVVTYAQNVNSSETLHNNHEIFIGSSKHQKQ